ncbi:glycosyl-4,4'-diaponeurosporenoate acyltransferase CrtO family protein [Mangrovivirga cuniculi]|uniref:Glycosyl-4,4'-diaponeurosporenoate acyltransferase n=1 Tax=Mangrovivirga cuniculi TaxID=2715131 RepID=A0A4D7JLV0_9BACT|nr:hypothetical protein [Mangrovivirga cuniculi]QCK15617.1 hypothetical protein DCC35_13115 [Mangrovivirga cuniculi]
MNWYFKPRKKEIPFYELIGVRKFKKHLLNFFGENYSQKQGWLPLKNRSENYNEAFKKFINKTKQNEVVHLIVMLILLILSVETLLEGKFLQALSVVIINIPFNVYPIILQRYNRFRIYQILKIDRIEQTPGD